MITTSRSIHEQIALDAIAGLQTDRNPNAAPVIDFIQSGVHQGYYTAERADDLIDKARTAERQQRERLRQARELSRRTA